MVEISTMKKAIPKIPRTTMNPPPSKRVQKRPVIPIMEEYEVNPYLSKPKKNRLDYEEEEEDESISEDDGFDKKHPQEVQVRNALLQVRATSESVMEPFVLQGLTKIYLLWWKHAKMTFLCEPKESDILVTVTSQAPVAADLGEMEQLPLGMLSPLSCKFKIHLPGKIVPSTQMAKVTDSGLAIVSYDRVTGPVSTKF